MTAAGPPPRIGAILLAGGRGTRLGGVDKAAIVLDGATLLERAARALRDLPFVVVGPPRADPAMPTVREEPPGSGPAAAVVAGLAALRDAELEHVLLLAVDLVRLPDAVPLLLEAPLGGDGAVVVDPEGRMQWLLGRYRAVALRDAADRLGDPVDASLRALLGRLELVPLRLPAGLEADLDTVTDVERARAVLPETETR